MARQANQSKGAETDPFAPSGDETRAARGTVQMQIRNALGMWAAGLEFWNVMVREWTASRRKAVEHAMSELEKADAESDPEKRAQLLANVFTAETTSALKDVLAASIRATDVGLTHGMRAMKEAGQAAERFTRGSGAATNRP